MILGFCSTLNLPLQIIISFMSLKNVQFSTFHSKNNQLTALTPSGLYALLFQMRSSFCLENLHSLCSFLLRVSLKFRISCIVQPSGRSMKLNSRCYHIIFDDIWILSTHVYFLICSIPYSKFPGRFVISFRCFNFSFLTHTIIIETLKILTIWCMLDIYVWLKW